MDIDNIGDIVEHAYSLYGKEVNTNRMVPNILDGLKTVYKRAILAALTYPKGKLIKVQELDGLITGKYHPHGGAAGVIGELVHIGIFDGEGNFGYNTMTQNFPQAACLTEDTKIDLRDGRSITIKKLVEEFENGKVNYVYSCSKDGHIHNGRIINATYSGKKQIIEITLDNNEVIRSSLDHRFMLRSGEYEFAENLKVGDSLMPLYTKISGGRKLYQENYEREIKINRKKSRHLWDVAFKIDYNDLKSDDTLDDERYSKNPIQIHHIDRNKLNDSPDNLIKTRAHFRYHRNYNVGFCSDDYSEEKRSADGLKGIEIFKSKFDSESGYREHFRSMALSKNNDHHKSRLKYYSNRCIKTYLLLKDYYKISIDESNYSKLRDDYISKHNLTHSQKCCFPSLNTILRYYQNFDDLKEKSKYFNHKIINIKITESIEDVYDISVEKWENFALTAGVFVHNSRYIHCKLNDNFRDMVEPLMPYVRESLGEMDNKEKDYIATPIPILMSKSLTGLGIGCVNVTPSWTIKSLILATAKDNPELLTPTNGLKVSKEDKINFWNNNKGNITYHFNWKFDQKLNGWYIMGDPSVVRPNIAKLKKLKEDGRLILRDESSGDDHKLFIGIPKRISVDKAYIEKLVRLACDIKTRYDLWCVYGNVTRPVTGKYWCNYCFNNYQRLVEIYKKDKLSKLNIDLEAFTNFKDIADLIINRQDLSYSDIQTKLKLTSLAVVERVGGMSVGSMRTTDGQKRAEKVKEEIKKFENLTYKDLINPYLKSLK